MPGSSELCYVCGGGAFSHTPVLWPSLISAWGLSENEARYIDVQQGTHCITCNSNVRSIALARAIMRCRVYEGCLRDFVEDKSQRPLRLLEINEAGDLHATLRRLPGHRLVSYPDYDMTNLALESESFDLIAHSDSLEHTADPARGLAECRRVLRVGGTLAFTVPIVVGRLSRSRHGLTPSYHGQKDVIDPGMLVETEFGADTWGLVMQAGFSSCELVPFKYPAGIGIIAWR